MPTYPNKKDVEYKLVPDHPTYKVGNDGSIWSNHINGSKQGRTGPWWRMKIGLTRTGYCLAKFFKDGKQHNIEVQRLVLIVFVGPPPEGMEAAHEDGNPLNNDVSNLRWKTRSDNQNDRARHGTSNHGERQGSSKLTNEKVFVIRERRRLGHSVYSVAADNDVTISCIYDIWSRRTWDHI